MKRILASVLVLSIFSIGFIGCSGSNKTTPKKTEPAKTAPEKK
ncbi:MAG TPA: hypothetical protein VHE81_08995 [Lacipirellulaceae bacterium]|nr:hypothetical protein [Lacipirellulaceae bacterium]